MRLDHPDYNKLVLEVYENKRANNELSPLLARPTPAGIRKECATVYQERFDKKDEPMLRAFFGPAEQGRKFLTLIENFDVNKFRPLNSYLKDPDTKSISDRNIELLAWLIDFKQRPYFFGKQLLPSEKQQLYPGTECAANWSGKNAPEPNTEKEWKTTPATEPGTAIDFRPNEIEKKPPANKGTGSIREVKRRKNIFRIAVAICSSMLVSYAAIFFYHHYNKTTQNSFGNSNAGCMYWANDHYEEVGCKEAPNGRFFLPLDKEKMNNFKKITNEDTITEKSIGIIYYLSTNKKKEYFTAGGKHPVQLTRDLKLLSRHIYNTYLQKRQDSGSYNLAKEK